MKITPSQYGQLLEEISLLSSPAERDRALSALAKIILRQKDQKKLAKMGVAWEKLISQKKQVISGEVFWAGVPTKEKNLWLEKITERKEQETGKKIEWKIIEDKKLLGGLKLKIGNEIWDASWQKKVTNLTGQLKNGE